MAEIWTITGEAGKGLDATSRTLSQAGMVRPVLTFRNLAADTLVWTVALDGLVPSAELIPSEKQVVSLYRSGVKWFRGHVTAVRQKGRSVQVTASGPFWWLERMFLETAQTDGTGASGQRASYGFPSQTLDHSLGDLLALAVTMGVEMTVGALATTFTAPQLRLSQMSFGQAVAELCRVTPDLVLWFDYSGTLPAARTSRRLYESAVTLDAETLEDGFDLQPQTELEVSQVKVPYLVRAVDGNKQFASQNAGTPALGKVQMLTVSGDEMDTFLPKDLLDSATLQTVAGISDLYVAQNDAVLAPLLRKYGVVWGNVGVRTAEYQGSTGYGGYKTLVEHYFPGVAYQTSNGTVLSPTGRYLVTTGTLPDWAMELYGGVNVTVTGTWVASYIVPAGNTQGYGELFAAEMVGAQVGNGYAYSNVVGAGYMDLIYWLARPFSIQAVLLTTPFAASTTVYKPADYGFVAPPAGFAAGLLAAQNYTPVAGSLSWMAEDCGPVRYLPTPVNVSNAGSAFTAMKAMVSTEELDLDAGVTTLELGAPVRFSYAELVNKMRGSSNDNIVYL